MKLWKVFYNRNTGEEYAAYTIMETFEGEEEATAELIAYDKGIDRAEIETRVEKRS